MGLFGSSTAWRRTILASLLLEAAAVFFLIIPKVPYTEIDWEAYMAQIRGYLSGERNYSKLEGATGPLVYPAGFVYVYSALFYITENGLNIEKGQVAFAFLYLLLIFVVLRTYSDSTLVPVFVGIFVCLSRRLHSIFVLRLFNDGIAMILLYAALIVYGKRRWLLGSFLYTVALSIKMNILLFLPGVAVSLVLAKGWTAIVDAALMVLVQVALAWPFLEYDAGSYMNRAFNFGRQFEFKWTVNWKFLPVEVFHDRRLHTLLLVLHVVSLLYFFYRTGRLQRCVRILLWRENKVANISPAEITTSALASNMIGIVFCRSLHFQFYSWYFHCVPFLVWIFGVDFSRRFFSAKVASVPAAVLVVLFFGAIEFVYNVYPATPFTSTLLNVCHYSLLALLLLGAQRVYTSLEVQTEKSQQNGASASQDAPTDGADKATQKVEQEKKKKE